MVKNTRIKIRALLFLVLICLCSSPIICLNIYISQNEARTVNEKNLRSSNFIWNYTAEDAINSVAMSSNGNYIVAGSADNKVYFFDRINSIPLWNFTTGGSISSVAISPDGQYIVAGSFDSKVYLFNKTSSSPLWSYTTGGSIISIDISSDGQYIVAGSVDNNVYLFNRTNPAPLWSYTTGGSISSLAISSDGLYIVAGTFNPDGKDYLFERDSSTPLWYYNSTFHVTSVAISSDGQYIISGDVSGDLYFFDKSSSTPLWNYTVSSFSIDCVDISLDGQNVVMGDSGGTIYFFDKSNSIPLWWNSDLWGTINSVAISSNGQYIALGSGQKVYLFDKDNSIPLWSYTTENTISSVAISYEGQYIIAGNLDSDGKVYLLDNSPWPFTLSSNAGNPDDDGSFTLFWTTSFSANNYSIYQYSSLITQINGSLNLLATEITDMSLPLNDYTDGIYYFIVNAKNNFGNISSNCIELVVQITKSVTIINPDISSSWETSTSQSISWSSTGSISNVKIELYKNDTFVMEIISSTSNDGEFSWVVPSVLENSNQYQIRVIDVSDNAVFSLSDYFEIKAPSSPGPTPGPVILGYDLMLIMVILGISILVILKRYREINR